MLASLIAGLATGETLAALRRAKRAAIAYAAAGVLALVGIVFLLVAGAIWAAERYGATEATLVIGVAFLVLAGLVLIVHKLTSQARARAAARRRNRDFTKAAVAAGIAVAPALLRGRAGTAVLLAPAIAAIAYAIYRENSRPDDPGEES
ncbi:hypothetical protein RB623_05970 [Mesorhizobium sp. LHD-90]|uniref:hypothetical protein n=1 Tax=Mesorhizobium sp. LHD-90 TaxID=3071414 RepID=UPI0027E023BD|nr:hypothetical protein [Mesorhizobium sp. LHD-90]MDQ6433596.1 hypothetical protein [Mesorhizobium sp. LHD-90]